MSRLLLMFLAIATLSLTPVGMFVCGSLALADHMPEEVAGSTSPCAHVALMQLAETAVTSYLTTPYLVKDLAFSIPLLLLTAVFLSRRLPPILFKRKPPTPPPNICFC